MSLHVIDPGGSRGPIGPYSPAIVATEFSTLIFVSGQIAMSDGAIDLDADAATQLKIAIKNGFALLEAAGVASASVVKVTVFVTDLGQANAINEAYSECFEQPYPARSMVEVSRLPRGAAVEVEFIAVG